MKIHQFDDNVSLLHCKFLTVMNIGESLSIAWWKNMSMMKIHYYDENPLLQWRFIDVMQIQNCDENSFLGLNCVPEMKIFHFDEKSSLDEDSLPN